MSQGNAGLGQIGRIREGRVDTGEQVFVNEPMVSAELLRRGLTNAGFGLDDLHWFEKKPSGKHTQTKSVVNLVFTRKDAPIADYPRTTTEALRELASHPWFCHIWLNPNGVVTVNFVGLQNGEPRQEVVVRDGKLTMVSYKTEGSGQNGINLDEVETILVKFFFTNPKHIPLGILRRERALDAEMDRRHASEVVSQK